MYSSYIQRMYYQQISTIASYLSVYINIATYPMC